MDLAGNGLPQPFLQKCDGGVLSIFSNMASSFARAASSSSSSSSSSCWWRWAFRFFFLFFEEAAIILLPNIGWEETTPVAHENVDDVEETVRLECDRMVSVTETTSTRPLATGPTRSSSETHLLLHFDFKSVLETGSEVKLSSGLKGSNRPV